MCWTHYGWTIAGLLLAATLVGCSSSDTHGEIVGEVFLDNAPLSKGQIRFVPTDGKRSPTDAEITNGKFTARVPVGEAKVEITAPKVIGTRKMYPTNDSPTVDDIVGLLPARFNVESKLKMTVEPGRQE